MQRTRCVATKKTAKRAKKKVTKRAKKTKNSRPRTPPSSRAMAKKKVAKKKTAKKTTRKVVRKKPTKKERRAAHPVYRKPQTNYREARLFFGAKRTSADWTPELVEELKLTFLRVYATKGIIAAGLSAADVARSTYKRWREEDEAFNEACVEAEEMAADLLEMEARRRAEDGIDHPVIFKGEITDTYKQYSDTLMLALLKGVKPDKYKERKELSGSVGRPMTLDSETKESVVSSILGMIRSKPDPAPKKSKSR